MTLRPYQDEAIESAVSFINDVKSKDGAGIIVAPTGAGKSFIIAGIAAKYSKGIIIFQPSKTILEQNYDKYVNVYGFKASIYSASMKQKEVGHVTFATIKSVKGKAALFKHAGLIIIDECHTVNAKGGEYLDFIEDIRRLNGNRGVSVKILGLSATPWRLNTDGFGGSMIKFITRTRPKVFKKVIYLIQTKTLFDAGYLSKLYYYSIPFDSSKVALNSTGADYKEESLRAYYESINYPDTIVSTIKELLSKGVKSILVFTAFIKESEYIVSKLKGKAQIVTGEDIKGRNEIFRRFESGEMPVLCNVGVATTGYDFPNLRCALVARPTMSGSLWFQMIGRAARIFEGKPYGIVVDMGDNLRLFGKMEDMEITEELPIGSGKYYALSKTNGRKLTNQYFER